MAKQSITWWGQRFIEALEAFTDPGRLQRGRGYSSDNRILSFEIDKGLVTATVRGNVNPYFGVYKEPRYITKIQMKPIAAKDWTKVIGEIGCNAALVSQLLMNEMPDDIETAFAQAKSPLLPGSRRDFKLTDCSCPDYAVPCKHIAGVYYRLAGQLDRDPFLLFELRGLPRKKLHQELSKTPLGQALVALADEGPGEIVPAESYYTRPQSASTAPDYRSFWQGSKALPSQIEPATPAVVPAILVKKGGDYPAFWDRANSFLEVMEDLYRRVRMKNKDTL